MRRSGLAVALIAMAACSSPTVDTPFTWPTGGSVAVTPGDTGAAAGVPVALAIKTSSPSGPFALPTSGVDAPVWSSEAPAIATVDQHGVVTGHAAGTTLIHLKTYLFDETSVFTVPAPIASVGIAMREDRLVVPASFRIFAVLRSAAGDSLPSDFEDLVWTSSDTAVARVTAYHDPGYHMKDAMLTLTGYGTARITLTAARERLSSSVTISPAPIQYRVVRVGAHENFTGLSCALDVDGHPYCWSRNLYTQTIPHQWFTVAGDTTPVPLALKTSLTFDSLAVGFEHACALTHGGDA